MHPDPGAPVPDLKPSPPILVVPSSTKRLVAIQILRTAAQAVGTIVVADPALTAVLDGAGLDPGDFTSGVFAVALVLWIVLLRLLERLHPAFGWLNGWRASPVYVPPEQLKLRDY